MADLSGWKAEPQHLPSIGTLHARAFHAKSEFHRRVLPASIAPWWEEKYALDLKDPTCHVLKISPPESSATVSGLLTLRKYEAGQRGAGRWSSFEPPPNVDREDFDAMIAAMVKYREMFMLEQPHYCIDHFGVDAACQGEGLGTKLLAKACEVAESEGADIFVEANEFAESFYQRHGFETRDKMAMPGGMTECFLVRRAKK